MRYADDTAFVAKLNKKPLKKTSCHNCVVKFKLKKKWQKEFLSSHLKDYYRIFIPALFRDILIRNIKLSAILDICRYA